MADFPRITWLEVDGRLVPMTEPQHFTGQGNETVRTGANNPLPVANYVQKNGVWVPVNENNPVPTQVTGSIVRLSSNSITDLSIGAQVEVSKNIDMVKYKRFYIECYHGNHPGTVNFSIKVRRKVHESSNRFIGKDEIETLITVEDGIRRAASTEFMDANFSFLDVFIENKSTSVASISSITARVYGLAQ